jgi:hypothetical protein
MDQNQEDLGPAGVWQIREFPKGLRQYLADEARKEGIVVGELLTRIVAAYRAGTLGRVAPNGFANPSNGGGNDERLDLAIERIRRLAEVAHGMPKEVATLAFGLIKADLRDLKDKPNGVLKHGLTHQGKPSDTRTETAKLAAPQPVEPSDVNELAA